MSPNVYWLKRAVKYRMEGRLEAPFYRAQEAAVVELVKSVAPRRVLEVGCNAGRIAGVLRAALPVSAVSIAACDLSPDAIAAAEAPGVRFFVHDLYSAEPLPPADLCVAIEVFLHHPIAAVRGFVEKILGSCQMLLHEFDPAVEPGALVAEHCFAHDYPALYRSMGLSWKPAFRGEHAFLGVWRAA